MDFRRTSYFSYGITIQPKRTYLRIRYQNRYLYIYRAYRMMKSHSLKSLKSSSNWNKEETGHKGDVLFQLWYTVMSRAVDWSVNIINFKILKKNRQFVVCTLDWSTIQFLKLLAKGHCTQASNFSLINILKMLGCATNRYVLLLLTLRYLFSM